MTKDIIIDAPRSQREAAITTRIGRTYRFESAHYLPNLPDGHRCKNLHGQNYRIYENDDCWAEVKAGE